MTGNREHRCDQTHRHQHLACHEGCGQSADIGREIDHLHIAGGSTQIHLGKIAEDQQQESSGTGAVETIIGTHHKGGSPNDCPLKPGVDLTLLLRKLLLLEHDKGHHRQHDQQQVLQIPLIQGDLQLGAQVGAIERKGNGRDCQPPIHKTVQ